MIESAVPFHGNEHVARFNAANLTPAHGGVAAPHADPHW
jgi:hypothetical protein